LTNSSSALTQFLHQLTDSWQANTFVKLSLGNYQGKLPSLKNLYGKRLNLKTGTRLSFTYRYITRDETKNYTFEEAITLIQSLLSDGFKIATIQTTTNDYIFDYLPNGKTRLRTTPPTTKDPPTGAHDRIKQRSISATGKSYLHYLGITDLAGTVLKDAQDKFKQINHFIELLRIELNALSSKETIRVVDMGAGKGYLTFALYDYLTTVLNKQAQVTGIEYRAELVDLCNNIANQSGFTSLNFEAGKIEDSDCANADVVIALHACDTATDDALAKGIEAKASLIVVAPCCHKQIRRAIEKSKTPTAIDFITRHGIYLEREAEMITDSLRILILEYFGYKCKAVEFIADAHTHKNVMLIAQKTKLERNPAALEKINAAKIFFGIEQHYLEKLLKI
jgi:protein-L-isoaspartate O-methyltransferase